MINSLIIENNLNFTKDIINYTITNEDGIIIRHVSTTYEDALKAIANNVFDLIFIDLDLNEKYDELYDDDALDFVDKLYSFDTIRNPNIVLISKNMSLIRNIKDRYSIYNPMLALDSRKSLEPQIQKIASSFNSKKGNDKIKALIIKELERYNLSFKYSGTKYILDSVLYIYESNDLNLLDDLENNVYTVLAEKYRKKLGTIKTNVLKATSSANMVNENLYITPKIVISHIVIKLIDRK